MVSLVLALTHRHFLLDQGSADLQGVFVLFAVLQSIYHQPREWQFPLNCYYKPRLFTSSTHLVDEGAEAVADRQDQKRGGEEYEVSVVVLRAHRHRPHVDYVAEGGQTGTLPPPHRSRQHLQFQFFLASGGRTRGGDVFVDGDRTLSVAPVGMALLHVTLQLLKHARVFLQAAERFAQEDGQNQDSGTGGPASLHILCQFLSGRNNPQ